MYKVWYVNALEAKLVSPVTMVTLLVLSVHKAFQHRDKDVWGLCDMYEHLTTTVIEKYLVY